MKALIVRISLLALALFLIMGGYSAWVLTELYKGLPDVRALRHSPLSVPLTILTRDGRLMGVYGQKRRDPVEMDQVPIKLIQAIVATEDQRFYQHMGVDVKGLLRAMVSLVATGKKIQGGSTITMQLARNYFLTRERTYERKLKEILLAIKIERNLTKNEILNLYLNKIFFGHRAYGVQAAAQVYYGRPVSELTLAELAMLAGLPKAPSKLNPLTNPVAAKRRRAHVLGRMHDQGYINVAQLHQAMRAPIEVAYHGQSLEVEAPYVTEMVRQDIVKQFGSKMAYSQGLTVVTTIEAPLQNAANQALRKSLMDYDTRHGYRGPEYHLTLDDYPTMDDRLEFLSNLPAVGVLEPALVLEVSEWSADLILSDGQQIQLDWHYLKDIRPFIDVNQRGPRPSSAHEVLNQGDVVRLRREEGGGVQLAQIPEVNGALVALDAQNGAIKALVGGFDYAMSSFNRVTQAKRQPGSSFKPFLYSAALEKGFTAASILNDAPVVYKDQTLQKLWRPENYSGQFFGPTRLRTALTKSRNLVSIRLLKETGVDFALEHVKKFGFESAQLPRNLSLALGTGEVTPMELAGGYATIANGGFKVSPYFIQRIEDANGHVLYEVSEDGRTEIRLTTPIAEEHFTQKDCSGDECVTIKRTVYDEPVQFSPEERVRAKPRALSPENAYIMTSLMQSVIQEGTGRAALRLGRNDLAGKTGTTNDQTDAWFSGFNQEIVATAWVGFDQPKSMGVKETGARAALPMWVDFMSHALKASEPKLLSPPDGIVTAKIDPESGLLATVNTRHPMFEIFRKGYAPTRAAPSELPNPQSAFKMPAIPEQLF